MTAVETSTSAAPAEQANKITWNQPLKPARFATRARNLHFAMALHRRGDLRKAEHLYRAVLKVDRSDFDCLHNLGLLCAQEGRLDDAVRLLRAGARQDPRSPEAHNNLANVLAMMQRHDQAAAGFRTAIALRPDFAEAHNNLANALAAQGKTEEAARHYRQAIALRPAYGDAHLNLGRMLSNEGALDSAATHYRRALALGTRPAETHCLIGDLQRRRGQADAAAASYRQAIKHAPDLVEAWLGLGHALRREQKPAEAIAVYRQALAKGADAQIIHYYLAALGAAAAPPATPRRLVSAIFDRYSARYDRHVVERLKYRTPNLLFDLVVRSLPARDLKVVDLGCGTGLAGALFRPLAGNLVGVDMSASMLELARQRGVYDELFCGELIDFLRSHRARCDLALAADVLVYLGDLGRLFACVHQTLAPGGRFVFSVEAAEGGELGQDFVLQPTLRYAHSAAYLRRQAEKHGFVFEAIEMQALRREEDRDINGHLVILRRN
ncbi:MAG TPA: tetratricopeptide repeat protein [Xanthobacteraceae bacterium]|nr:tetratricopeptide repeat protein [Xanthobacteraceae bacterium]